MMYYIQHKNVFASIPQLTHSTFRG